MTVFVNRHLKQSRLKKLFYRVVTALAPRVTAQNAPGAAYQPSQNAIFINRFICILRARRVEAATSGAIKNSAVSVIGGKGVLVETD